MLLSQLPGPLPAEVRKPLACPADAVESPWVDTRREMQPATAARFAHTDAFAGHLKPKRTERSILYRNEGATASATCRKRPG